MYTDERVMTKLDTILDGDNDSGRASMASLFYHVGFLLVFFLTSLQLSVCLSLILGMGVTPFHLPLAAGLTIVVGFYSANRMGIGRVKPITSMAYFVVAVILSIIIAMLFYDRSFDGQAYHQEAIIQLAAGWNPYYDTLADSVAHKIWLTHYAKGPWLQAGAFYELTSSLESGKAVNILLMFASWFFVAALMLSIKRVSIWAGIIIATLAALNPVSVYQGVSYYVDGQLSSIFISLIALLSMAIIGKKRHFLMAAAALVILLVNIKFTGLVYAALIIFAYAIASLYINQLKETIQQASILTAGFVIGFLLVGFNPYVTNTFEHGNIFFPLRGDNAIDVVSHAKPIPFKSMNRIEALVNSTFSASSNSKEGYTLKVPFHIPSRSELKAISAADPRLAGFGPWFSGALVLSAVGFLVILVTCKTPLIRLTAAFFVGSLLATVLINPESWWARYVPQLYLIPLITCAMLFLCAPRKIKVLATALLIALSVNASVVLFASLKENARTSIAINSQLATLSADNDASITTYFSVFQAMRVRLNDAGVKFSSVDNEANLPCDNPSSFFASFGRAKFCMPDSVARQN